MEQNSKVAATVGEKNPYMLSGDQRFGHGKIPFLPCYILNMGATHNVKQKVELAFKK